jgi:hypothetical protein
MAAAKAAVERSRRRVFVIGTLHNVDIHLIAGVV